MNQEPVNNIAVADYRWKYILYAVVCWGLVLAGFLAFRAKERHWQFWMAEVVMLLFALGISYMLLNRKYRFIGRKGPEFEAFMNNRFREMMGETGRFSYNDEGFVFYTGTGEVVIRWAEIHSIVAHLEDEVTNDDDICLRINYGDDHFLEVDEEIQGWILFCDTLQNRKLIPENWTDDLLKSDKKELVLYSRSN